MYFQNQDFKETAASLIELTLATGRLDWFGPECLEDARLFRP
jgi:virulence-associated protein VapD